MSAGREAILARVRAAVGRRVAHPGPAAAASAPTPFADFARVLETVGGTALGPVPPGAVADALREQLAAWGVDPGRERVVATRAAHAHARAAGALGLEPGVTPQSLADAAVGIAWGAVGVAESGAVAVADHDPAERALLFLAERVVLLLPAERVVGDLHGGLAALDPAQRAEPRLVWISGPSKTADIEQALVLGAHGPRALAVLGIGPTGVGPAEPGPSRGGG